MELRTDVGIEEKKLAVERERILKDLVDKIQKNETDLDTKGLDALVKMAIEQSKKETENGNNEEG
jgi:hypothetical protein